MTQLLIQAFHQKLAHAGQDHILAQLREQFWIPKGRSAVRKVVRSCLTCKKQRAVRMEQMMATLPAFRITAYEPCFTYTGVDYFGPLNVKRGRSVVKRWGAIFTCLNSRAVYLEVLLPWKQIASLMFSEDLSIEEVHPSIFTLTTSLTSLVLKKRSQQINRH